MKKTTGWRVTLMREEGRWRTSAEPLTTGASLPDGVNLGDVHSHDLTQWSVECRSRRHFPTALKKLRRKALGTLMTTHDDLMCIPEDIMLETLNILK